ncbi:MAG: hypothetical protein IIT77_05480, partial [Oscillospiraceae bacterium]|nr:hypothetical protein [Oscillospiraceae bacterium]
TGSEIIPEIGSVTVTVNKRTETLTEGLDYEVVENTLKDNINKGTASFTIRGLGNYGDTKKVTFKIYQRNANNWWQRFLGE